MKEGRTAVAKIGRNDPCPCGSGKKFKKCCIDKPAYRSPAVQSLGQSGGISASRREGMLSSRSSRAIEELITRMANPMDLFGGPVPISRRERRLTATRGGEARWTEDAVRVMSNAEIFSHLRALGIESSEESFWAMAVSGDSSERLFEETWGTRWNEATDDDALFAWLAMDVLWERLVPDRVRIEDVDRRIGAGYELLEQERRAAALETWWEAWEKLKVWLGDKPVRTFDHIDDLARDGLTDFFINWIWDCDEALSNAMEGDSTWANRRLELFDDLRNRLVDEGGSNAVNLARACGESLFALRRKDEGDACFAALIEQFPDNVWGYIGWADEYNPIFARHPDYADKERAREIYRRGLERTSAEQEDVILRLERLEGVE